LAFILVAFMLDLNLSQHHHFYPLTPGLNSGVHLIAYKLVPVILPKLQTVNNRLCEAIVKLTREIS